MMFESLFNSVSSKDKEKAIESLVVKSSPRYDFFLMVFLAVSMAAFGAILDSNIILIGSMLIAPVLYPTLSLALGLVSADSNLITRSFYTIAKSFSLAIVAGFFIGVFFDFGRVITPTIVEIITAKQASLAYVIVAAISGVAASFAVIKPSLNETLPGVAISVSLVPPLAVIGLGLARFDWNIISSSFLVFLVNVSGIVFSSMVVFSLFKLSMKRSVVKEIVKEDNKKVEAEKSEQ